MQSSMCRRLPECLDKANRMAANNRHIIGTPQSVARTAELHSDIVICLGTPDDKLNKPGHIVPDRAMRTARYSAHFKGDPLLFFFQSASAVMTGIATLIHIHKDSCLDRFK